MISEKENENIIMADSTASARSGTAQRPEIENKTEADDGITD